MATAPIAPLTSLPNHDAQRARVGNALLRLLASETVQVAQSAKPEGHGQAFVVGDDLAFILQDLPNVDVDTPNIDVDTLCDALDAADPLLAHVEERLKRSLNPSGFVALSESAFALDKALIVTLKHAGHILCLAICADDGVAAQWEDAASARPINLAAIPFAVSLDCLAARLPLADAAGIAAGDLLLLPHMLSATLMAANDIHENGHFEIASGIWRPGSFAEAEDGMSDSGDGPESSSEGFTVPVTLHLPQQAVDAATLTALAPGAVLSLSPLIQGLSVELRVGGRRIARGEIVEMGENFAVHIDESYSTPASASEPGPAFEEAEDE